MRAVPWETFTPKELESKTVVNVTTDLGPTRQLEADGFDEDGSEGEQVSLILLDWLQVLYQHLKRSENPIWPADTIWPHAAEGVYRNLDLEELVMVAHVWVGAIWVIQRRMPQVWSLQRRLLLPLSRICCSSFSSIRESWQASRTWTTMGQARGTLQRSCLPTICYGWPCCAHSTVFAQPFPCVCT